MKNSLDLTFFFGAGASAPFGIPTMKRLVELFETELKEKGTDPEIQLFNDITNTLKDALQRPIDLEDIFTIINGIKKYDIDQISLVAIYASIKEFDKIPLPQVEQNVCKNLEDKFEKFLREKCMIRKSYQDIFTVYQDFFTKACKTTSTTSSMTHRARNNVAYCPWTIFTTNYDTCLEYFWRERVQAPLYTGFSSNQARRAEILDQSLINVNDLTLVKLHGSLNWMIEPDGTVIEESASPSRSFIGRTYEGPMMIYPIQQKELYVEPFISMFSRLNKELHDRKNWIIIGYSFKDPIIREIFLRNSDESKHIVFLHPHGTEITREYLSDLKYDKYIVLKKKFGMHDNYQEINELIVNSLSHY